MSQKTEKTLRSTIWLGSAGALLILGGISALLASNWVRVPLLLQIITAFTPLVCGWVGYFRLLRRKTISAAQNEILGIVWTGGVVCSIALLGRILQLSSSAFIFCATVTVLLLPVVYALRSTAAWLSAIGFAVAAAISQLYEGNDLQNLFFLLLVSVIIYARLSYVWQKATPGNLGQRWLVAVSSIPVAITISVLIDGYMHSELLYYFPAFALPLLAGTLLERNETPTRRPLMILGAIVFCIASLVFIAKSDYSDDWNPAESIFFLIELVLLITFARRLLRKEGLFLLLFPITSIALLLEIPLICLTLALGVGAAVITAGVRTGQRMLANEGLLFIIITAFILFAKTDMTLTLQGFFLVLSGIAMVILNFIITRMEQKEVPDEE